MNHYVPDFEMEEDYLIPASSSGLSRSKKSAMTEEDDIMELLWQNGQVVMQSQNQRSSFKKSEVLIPAESSPTREIRCDDDSTPHLFMQEDEMTSWLHYPLDESPFDRELCADLLYPPPRAPLSISASSDRTTEVRISPPVVALRPPVPPLRRVDAQCSSRLRNFKHFSRPLVRIGSGSSSSSKAGKEMTVEDSNETPVVGPDSTVSYMPDSTAAVSGGNTGFYRGNTSGTPATVTSSAERDHQFASSCEVAATSSPGGSGASVSASAEAARNPRAAVVNRKRKDIEEDDECPSEDVETEFAGAKKQVRGSRSTKKTRAAEVHNLSERRRRDRINEKMRALQELIPHCNKSDKASMLDEAIDYLKSLQLQVQMMSMGGGMVPVMFPGVQQYMTPMGMGMGMGMAMGMNHQQQPMLMQFPPPFPTPPSHLGQRFPIPAFHAAQRPVATNHSDPNNQHPTFADPYHQHHLSLQNQHQQQHTQNQTSVDPSNRKPINSRKAGDSEN